MLVLLCYLFSPCYVRFCQWKYLEYNVPHLVSLAPPITTPIYSSSTIVVNLSLSPFPLSIPPSSLSLFLSHLSLSLPHHSLFLSLPSPSSLSLSFLISLSLTTLSVPHHSLSFSLSPLFVITRSFPLSSLSLSDIIIRL